jgi:hypothetical protein
MVVSPDHGMTQLNIAIFCDKDIIHTHGGMRKIIIREMFQAHDTTAQYWPDLMFLKRIAFLNPQVQLLSERMRAILIEYLHKMWSLWLLISEFDG